MLVNEELKDLSLPDLNQRYANSWVNYNNQIEYIKELMPSIYGVMLAFLRNPEEGGGVRQDTWLEKFDWSKMDTFRPPPRLVMENNNVWFLAYKNDRQWCRGFCFEKNVALTPVFVDWHSDRRRMLEQWLQPVPEQKLRPIDLRKDHAILLSRSLGWVYGHMYFRDQKIATIGPDNSLLVTNTKFMQEIGDHTDGVKLYVKESV